jgi:hypothetical protein
VPTLALTGPDPPTAIITDGVSTVAVTFPTMEARDPVTGALLPRNSITCKGTGAMSFTAILTTAPTFKYNFSPGNTTVTCTALATIGSPSAPVTFRVTAKCNTNSVFAGTSLGCTSERVGGGGAAGPHTWPCSSTLSHAILKHRTEGGAGRMLAAPDHATTGARPPHSSAPPGPCGLGVYAPGGSYNLINGLVIGGDYVIQHSSTYSTALSESVLSSALAAASQANHGCIAFACGATTSTVRVLATARLADLW